MKRCPKCNRTYKSDAQKFCTFDGETLPLVEVGPETIIDSSQAEAPTKAISRELVSDALGQIDPYKTIVEQRPADETTQMRRRVTQDLEPPSTTLHPQTLPKTSPDVSSSSGPITPPPQTSTPLPPPPPAPQTSGSLPGSGQISSQTPPAQQTSGSLPGSGPIVTSAPLPQPEFAGVPPQQVQPSAAPVPGKKSKLPWVLGILAVLLVVGAVLGVAAIIFVPRFIESRRLTGSEPPRPIVNEPTPSVEATPIQGETPNPITENEPPPYAPPADAVGFVNSNENLDGKLAEHYVDFSFYYPERWEKDPKSGVPGASNFAKVERRLPPDFTQEIFAVGWYSSAGSTTADRALFSSLIASLNSQYQKTYPEYRKISEGETKVGVYEGYELRFEGLSRDTARGDLKLWGRVILLPPPGGGKNGVTLLMLATSLAPELRTVDDVGEKGELPMILESFRFGKK